MDRIDRRLTGLVRTRIGEEPVVLVQGPRSVGKSTLLRQVADEQRVPVFDLDDLEQREVAADDPSRYATHAARPVCIDEYQHVPTLLDAIKAELNQDTSPGRFLLTGSTRFDQLPSAQALTGRLHRMTLLPLSQGELGRGQDRFLDLLLAGPDAVAGAAKSKTARDEYPALVCAGGFPLAVARTAGASRNRWFDDYVSLTIERDVADLRRIEHPAKFRSLLGRLAGQTAQVLNVNAAASDLGMPQSTADRYASLMEAVFLLRRLPAWGTTLTSRSRALPKVHVLDSGLAARLLRITPERIADLDPTTLQQYGHLLETFVVGEVFKQASWRDAPVTLGHWRTGDGAEVDLVIEADDGSVAGVEVKAGTRVHDRDLAGLRSFRDKVGDRFVCGVVLHTGTTTRRVDGFVVAPIDSLWTA